MVTKNTKDDMLCQEKDYATKDTSYSSFWYYNSDRDINSKSFKDNFVNFYSDKKLLSEFNTAVAKNIISFWSEPNEIIYDPFAGRTRLLVSFWMDRCYIGCEVSKDVCNYLVEQVDQLGFDQHPKWRVDLFNMDCKNIKEAYKDNVADLVFTCPPYWDLEKYESTDGQLSDIQNYDEFMNALVDRLEVATDILKKDKYMCVVIGDFRRNGKYYTLHADLIHKMERIKNLKLHDVIVIQNLPLHTAAFYFGSAKKQKHTAKAHEYLLVWKKL